MAQYTSYYMYIILAPIYNLGLKRKSTKISWWWCSMMKLGLCLWRWVSSCLAWFYRKVKVCTLTRATTLPYSSHPWTVEQSIVSDDTCTMYMYMAPVGSQIAQWQTSLSLEKNCTHTQFNIPIHCSKFWRQASTHVSHPSQEYNSVYSVIHMNCVWAIL